MSHVVCLEDFNIIFASFLIHLSLSSFLDLLLLFFIADYAYKAIDALPVSAHPMTQFTTGVMALQVNRLFHELLIYTFFSLIS